MKTFRFSFAALAALVVVPFVSFVGCSDGEVIPIGSDAQGVSCSADADCPSGQLCTGGACAPDPSGCVPAAESCNGVDDDCDGTVDDGASCNDGTACVNGACGGGAGGAGGGFVSGAGGAGGGGPCFPNGSAPETCNGIDDDCNGVVDDGGGLCSGAEVCLNGLCQLCDPAGNCATPCASDADCTGTDVCQNGLCGPGCSAQPESCNGIDDDCDGVVDDGATCADGSACVNGACGGGGCDPANPGVESCNGVDDDCDGVVDEGNLCGGGVACLNGSCPVPCASDADCGFLQTCQNGYCAP